jgi:hypothetical protein
MMALKRRNRWQERPGLGSEGHCHGEGAGIVIDEH